MPGTAYFDLQKGSDVFSDADGNAVVLWSELNGKRFAVQIVEPTGKVRSKQFLAIKTK